MHMDNSVVLLIAFRFNFHCCHFSSMKAADASHRERWVSVPNRVASECKYHSLE